MDVVVGPDHVLRKVEHGIHGVRLGERIGLRTEVGFHRMAQGIEGHRAQNGFGHGLHEFWVYDGTLRDETRIGKALLGLGRGIGKNGSAVALAACTAGGRNGHDWVGGELPFGPLENVIVDVPAVLRQQRHPFGGIQRASASHGQDAVAACFLDECGTLLHCGCQGVLGDLIENLVLHTLVLQLLQSPFKKAGLSRALAGNNECLLPVPGDLRSYEICLSPPEFDIGGNIETEIQNNPSLSVWVFVFFGAQVLPHLLQDLVHV